MILTVLLLAPLSCAQAAVGVPSHLLIVRITSPGTEEIEFTVMTPRLFQDVILPSRMEVTNVQSMTGNVKFSLSQEGEFTKLALAQPQHKVTVIGSRTSETIVPGLLFHGEAFLGGFDPGRDEIRAFVEVPPNVTIFAAPNGTVFDHTLRRVSFSATGAAHMWFTYETEGIENRSFIDNAIFRVFVPPEEQAHARVIANLAADKMDEVAREAGVRYPWPGPIRVVPYTPPTGTGSSAEAGSFSKGVAFVDRVLLTPADPTFPLRGAGVFLHEAFHAMSLPKPDPAETTWFAEGSAVHAQEHIEPRSGYTTCVAGRCTVHGPGLSFEELEDVYSTRNVNDIFAWNAGEDRLLYRYAGFVVAAYIDRYGIEAYQSVWRAWAERLARDECDCGAPWLLDEMSRQSQAQIPAEEILFPLRQLHQKDPSAFKREMRHLLAEDSDAQPYDASQWIALAETYDPSAADAVFSPRPQGEVVLPVPAEGPSSTPLLIAVVLVLGGAAVIGVVYLVGRPKSKVGRARPVRVVAATPADEVVHFRPPEPVCPGTEDGEHRFEERAFERKGRTATYRVCKVCSAAEPASR